MSAGPQTNAAARSRAATRLNLLMCGLGFFSIALVIALVHSYGLFLGAAGDDYRAYRAAAEVAITQGMPHAYEIEPLRLAQEAMVRAYAAPEVVGSEFVMLPTPYLPIWVALFEPLLLFPPIPGFVVWTLLNVAGLVGYLLWFRRQEGGLSAENIVPALVMSFPAIDTLQWGQVSVWLMIFFGEFFRLTLNRSDLRAGLWLAGLLLKPQTLILLLPGLLIARRWRTLFGFGIGSGVVLGASILVGGVDSIVNYVQVLTTLSGDPATARPQYMMNWRALAVGLTQLLPDQLAWGLAMTGLAATLILALWLWQGWDVENRDRMAIVLLGAFAATGCVSWHAHGHMALPLAVPLLYLTMRQILPYKVLAVWLLAPYANLIARLALGESSQMGLFVAHLFVLGWSVATLRKSVLSAPAARQPLPA